MADLHINRDGQDLGFCWDRYALWATGARATLRRRLTEAVWGLVGDCFQAWETRPA